MKKLIVILVVLAIILMSTSTWAETQKQNRPYLPANVTDLTVTGDATVSGDLAVTGGITASTSGLQKGAKYIVYKSGGTVYVLNGETGAVASSSASLETELEYAMNNLTANRTHQERVVVGGDFTLAATEEAIDMPSYVYLDLTGMKITLADNFPNGTGFPTVFRNSDQTDGNTQITIFGGHLEMNGDGVDTEAGNGVEFVATGGVTTAVYSGSGSDDLTASATTGEEQYGDYVLEIVDSSGNPDTCRWSMDGGKAFSAATNCLTGPTELGRGVKYAMTSADGHADDDQWTWQTRVVSKVKVIGMKINQARNEGIQSKYVTEFEYSGNDIQQSGDDGISAIMFSNNGIIKNNIISVGVSGSLWGSGASSGIEIEDAAYNITINGNVIQGETPGSSGKGIIVVNDVGSVATIGIKNITISNNVISHISNAGITVSNNKASTTFENIVISGNTITDIDESCIVIVAAQTATVPIDGVTISGNTLKNCNIGSNSNSVGIIVRHSSTGTTIDNVLVSNNTINGTGSYGITIDDVRNAVVSGNIITNGAHADGCNGSAFCASAIYIVGDRTDGVTIVNNHIFDSRGTKLMYGIRLADDTMDHIRLKDNYIVAKADASDPEIDIDGTNPVEVSMWGNWGGLVYENENVANVADNATIAHGLSHRNSGTGVTPTYAFCTTSTADEYCSISGLDGTNLTIQLTKDDGTAGTTANVYWKAVFKPAF